MHSSMFLLLGEAAQHQIRLFEEIIPNVKKDLNLQLEELRNCIARLDRHETEAQLKAKSLEDHVESMRKQVAVMLSEEVKVFQLTELCLWNFQ